MQDKLIPFKKYPAIYHNNELRKDENRKPIYFYEHGFNELIGNLLSNLKE